MAITKSLYPPIIDSYMPAFDLNSKQGCKIYFSLSTLNSLKEIKHLQLTCSNLITNQNALYNSGTASEAEERKTWKNKIRFYTLDEIGYDEIKKRYFIYLKKEDIAGGFSNTTYKIQLRVGSIDFSYPIDDKASWITANLSNFSEWSTICLIKAIPKPTFSVTGFSNEEDYETVLQSSAINCVGSYYCKDASETLQNYRFRVYENEILIEDSGLISTPIYAGNDSNVINIDTQQVVQYTVQNFLEKSHNYILEYYYVTKNYYEETGRYNFTVDQNENFPINIKLIIEPDEKNGRNKLYMKSKDLVIGNLAIRRTSNKSNFKIWEDIKIIPVAENVIELEEYDYTIESGVWYKYGVQKITTRNERCPITIGTFGRTIYDHDKKQIEITEQEEIINNFEDCFLYGNGVQLKLAYNVKISNFQQTVLESKVDTIGSKYAFIRRNGNVYYKQFPISALITGLCDEDHLFTSAEAVYGGAAGLELYSTFNESNDIRPSMDYNFEREYRNLVYKFLYNGENKLFKSPTEGNVIVRLMNITFTPEETLGRLIYSFNGTVYEQGEGSISNLANLGVLTHEKNFLNIDTNIQKIVSKIGQFYGDIKAEEDLIARIKEENKKVEFGYIFNVGRITSIHIEAPPKTRFRLNNQELIMNDTGEYHYDDDIITDLVFHVNSNSSLDIDNITLLTDIVVNYTYQESIQEDNSNTFVTAYNYKVLGEVYQKFAANEDIAAIIRDRYYDNQSSFKIEVMNIESIRIEAQDVAYSLPNGTVVYKKAEFVINDIQPPFIMNDSGIYELQEGIVNINKLYFTTDTEAKIDYICRVRKGIY